MYSEGGNNAMRCQQLWTVFAGNIQSRVISPRNEGNNSPNSPSPLPSTSPAPKISLPLKIRQNLRLLWEIGYKSRYGYTVMTV